MVEECVGKYPCHATTGYYIGTNEVKESRR